MICKEKRPEPLRAEALGEFQMKHMNYTASQVNCNLAALAMRLGYSLIQLSDGAFLLAGASLAKELPSASQVLAVLRRLA